MEKWKCPNCGTTTDEIIFEKQSHGEFVAKDCKCGEVFEETKHCSSCSERYLEYELKGGLCEECYEDNFNAYTCMNIGEANKQEVEINGFLAYVFGDELEDLLEKVFEEIPENRKHEYIKGYLEENESEIGAVI